MMHVCEKCDGQPGSDSAIEKGCNCPVLDNGHGHNESWTVARFDCPVHGLSGGRSWMSPREER